MPTHYETLGVSESASADEIKSAFRAIARRHHPDVSDSEFSKDRFLEASNAYEVLNDPERKRSYDKALAHQREIDERKTRTAQQSSRAAYERVRMAEEDRSVNAEILHMNMLLKSHRFKDAEEAARAVLRKDNKSAAAYAVLAEAAMVRGDMDGAARYYGYAAQYDPHNRVYRQKNIQMQDAMERSEKSSHPDAIQKNAPIALGTGVFVTLVGSLYAVLANEPPAFPLLKPISLWPMSLFFMLLIAGLAVGVTMSISGVLDVYDSNRGSAVMRVPPATALGMVAVISFWAALVFYLLVGATQNAFNASLSRLMGAVFAALIVFTFAAWNLSGATAFQTFVWGGNLLYISAAVGWFVADSLKRQS